MKLMVGAALMFAGLVTLGVAVLAAGMELLATPTAWWAIGSSLAIGAVGASVVGND